MPWWVSVFVAAVAYCLLKWVLPGGEGETVSYQLVRDVSYSLAPWVALFFLVIAGFSFLFGLKRKVLFERQKDLNTLLDLSWKEFVSSEATPEK